MGSCGAGCCREAFRLLVKSYSRPSGHLQLGCPLLPSIGQQRDACAAAVPVTPASLIRGAQLSTQSQSLFLQTFADVCSCACPQPVCRVTQRQLNITVQKKESNWWERLTKQEKRPVFLAPDFDRWLDESDAEMELKEKVSPVGTCGLCCCSALELGLLH